MARTIPLRNEGLDELLAHTHMLGWLAEERQKHVQEVQRLTLLELMVREGMTHWVAHHYGIDIATEQWTLDIHALQLVEESPATDACAL